ncbi:MAG: nuclear transport factor 2 family protein [Ferruginibacter sp.]
MGLLFWGMKKNSKTTVLEVAYKHTDDSSQLSSLNSQFIKNFLTQDAAAHAEIIHTDFVCIESNGSIVKRDEYLKNWATDFDNSGYTSFDYGEEHIRIFGNMALVRAKTNFRKEEIGSEAGYTIYTDTYVKEKGEWKCVQVQITPVKSSNE